MKKKHGCLFLLMVFLLSLSIPMICSAGWKTKNGRSRYYIKSTKTYVKSSWKKIGGKWYYFDASGYLKTGRFQLGKDYYYVTRAAGRYTNARKGNYYYGADGKMVKSCWKKSNGHWYYYGSSGKAKYGKFTLNGKTYCCTKEGGKVLSQWYNKNYYDEHGVMATSRWIGTGSNKSYVDETGTITKGNKNPRNPLTADEEALLAALVYCEAGNQPYKGKVAVASVVINRMEDSRFPNTLRGVLYQSGQFYPAGDSLLNEVYKYGRYNGSPVNASAMKQCRKAAQEVSQEGSKLKGYFFFNTYYGKLKIGDHYFS